MDAYVRSLTTGQEEMIIDAEITRKNVINGQKTLDVTARQTDRGQAAYTLVINENYVLYGDDEYVIKNLTQKTKGKQTIKTFTAEHRFYEDLINMYIYNTLTGTYSLQQLCEFALAGTGYSVQIDSTGMDASIEVQNFGDNNSSALFQDAISKFSCEYEINGKVFSIAKELSRHTDNQFRYLMNAQDPQMQIDTTNLCTYIRGFGKQNDDGSYVTTAEYTSPLAAIYGIRHASPIRDDRFMIQADLLAYIKSQLTDSIPVTITLTEIELKQLGVQDVRKGDYCWVTIEPFGIDLELRISEVDDYNTNKSPAYIFGVLQKKSEDILSRLTKSASALPNIEKSASRIGNKVGESMTDIRQLKDANDTVFYPQTHAQAILGLLTFITANTVISINGKTGSVTLTASDVGAATQQDIQTAIQAISAGSLNLYSKQEIDDKLAAKQDLILTSSGGNKFTLAIADDGTLSTTPYTGG